MNRSQLVAEIAAKTGMTAEMVKRVLDTEADLITRTLAAGDRVQLLGFGNFEPKVIPSRWVRNPATGKKVKSKKRGRVTFRPAAQVRDYVGGVRRVPRHQILARTVSAVEPAPATKRGAAAKGKPAAAAKVAAASKGKPKSASATATVKPATKVPAKAAKAPAKAGAAAKGGTATRKATSSKKK